MKTVYCWRCSTDVLMFDKEEFEIIRNIHKNILCISKELYYWDKPKNLYFDALIDAYKEICFGTTRFKPRKPHDMILYHSVSLLGCPCKNCGRPLRTPRATLCGSCQTVADENADDSWVNNLLTEESKFQDLMILYLNKINLDINDLTYYLIKGFWLTYNKMYEDALKTLKISIGSRFPYIKAKSYFLLAGIYLNLGQNNVACSYLQKVIDMDPIEPSGVKYLYYKMVLFESSDKLQQILK